jgi:hypothetical protein
VSEPFACPVCRARIDQGPQCRRCKADLSLLFTLSEQRERALTTACHFLTQGRWPRALAVAHGVEALRSDGDARRLLAVGYLLRRDFARAWQWYNAALQKSAPE